MLKKKFILILIVLLIIFAGIAIVWILLNRNQKTPISTVPSSPISIPNSPSSSTSATTPSSTPPVQANTTKESKTYRNAEFGFEFQYPEDWRVIENPYGSPFSKFNLIIVPKIGKYLPDPILINIVVPQFADNAFRDLRGVGIIVADISGERYEYQEESLSEISIVLPFGQNKIILGANKQYEEVFNQFLASFKFLKLPQ